MTMSLCAIVLTSLLHYVTAAGPVDTHATPQTRALYDVMRTIAHDNKVMYGKHQPTLFGAYGGHSPYWTYAHNGRQEAWLFNVSQFCC
ncbi:hypothetical protein BaRGS_00036944 [Batillaria attramentaria]|uniref:Uncharacterized protein n=1 Tax=Batillaria attramentaria TaxID=370345 RepID=A0ABD0JBF6_9CAEN